MNFLRSLTSLIISITLAACATAYQMPGIEGLAADQIATLEYNGPLVDGVMVSHVDGEHRGLGPVRRFTLLPGQRKITVQPTLAGWMSKQPMTLTFNAAAGGNYELKYDFSLTNSTIGTWRAWIVEKDTNKTVSVSGRK